MCPFESPRQNSVSPLSVFFPSSLNGCCSLSFLCSTVDAKAGAQCIKTTTVQNIYIMVPRKESDVVQDKVTSSPIASSSPMDLLPAGHEPSRSRLARSTALVVSLTNPVRIFSTCPIPWPDRHARPHAAWSRYQSYPANQRESCAGFVKQIPPYLYSKLK
jgi:hypothetical protein